MKRILHITSSLERNGTETFIMNVFRNIDREKVMFDFLVNKITESGYEQEAKDLGASIYRFPTRREGFRKHVALLKKFFREHGSDYDAIHFSANSFTSMMAVRIAKKYGIPVRIVHAHSTSTRGWYNRLLHKINKKSISSMATHFLACSQKGREWGFQRTKAYDRSRVIYNGIDLEKFKFNSDVREEVRNELNLDDKFIIGHVGTFLPVKNHPFMLRILAGLKPKVNNAVLLLAGTGPQIENIKNMALEMGLEDSVVFLGNRKDVNRIFQAMDVFIFPSFFEGLPFAVIEAQTAGLPVLASNILPPEVALTNHFQYLDIHSGEQSWIDALVKLNGKKISRDFHEGLNTFDIKKTCKQLLKIYTSD